jgi:hypothetical protein
MPSNVAKLGVQLWSKRCCHITKSTAAISVIGAVMKLTAAGLSSVDSHKTRMC